VTLGSRLRRERVRAGLTQVELAARVGVHRGHIWKVESGVKQPSAALIERWSRVTGSAHADLVLDGPPLFDLAFDVDGVGVSSPFAARRVLDQLPAESRRLVAVWPSAGDTALRLRVRGSAIPVTVDLAGVDVSGVGVLGAPSITPVRASDELVTWVRASSDGDARAQVESRMASVAARGLVTVTAFGHVFVARVEKLSARASIRLQDLVEGSPIGLYVPSAV
jgi:transcriptional regulator with XRE-family HTH domain